LIVPLTDHPILNFETIGSIRPVSAPCRSRVNVAPAIRRRPSPGTGPMMTAAAGVSRRIPQAHSADSRGSILNGSPYRDRTVRPAATHTPIGRTSGDPAHLRTPMPAPRQERPAGSERSWIFACDCLHLPPGGAFRLRRRSCQPQCPRHQPWHYLVCFAAR